MYKPLRLALTAAVARQRGVCFSYNDYQVRWWSPSVERTTQRLSQDALCMILENACSLSTLTAASVA